MKTKQVHLFPVILLLYTLWLLPYCGKAQQDSAAEPPAGAKQDNPITVTAEVNYMRHYLWRGILFGSNDVSQPSINIQYRHFFIKPGINCNLVKKNLPKEAYKKPVMYDEQDIEAGYGNTLGKLEYEVKMMAYFYFNQINSPDTREAGLKLSYPLAKNITADSETAIDFGAYKGGLYNNTSLTWEYSLKKNNFLLQLGASTGNKKFIAAYFDTQAPALMFWSSKASFTHNMKNCYLSITGDYNFYSGNAIKNAAGVNTTDNFTITFGRQFSIR
jgi:hypothetical protein